MITFLPFADFQRSAECLDDKRLGKQRVEVLMILRTLSGETSANRNHPAIKMWRGYTNALVEYGLAICHEWLKRGFKDTISSTIANYIQNGPSVMPPWLGNQAVHDSHKSRLLQKEPLWYEEFGWQVLPCLPYVWPV